MPNSILRRSVLALGAAFALVGEATAKVGPHAAGLAKANGIDIAYESFGPTDRPAIVMIQGLGVQLVTWPSALIDELVRRGYRVIVFDNRDIGLSAKFDAAGQPDLAAVFAAMAPGAKPPGSPTLSPTWLGTPSG